MSLLDDVIELAHAWNLVAGVSRESDGCDAYRLRTAPAPIMVRVRPDGRFSGADLGGRPLTLGQVMTGVRAAAPATPLESTSPLRPAQPSWRRRGRDTEFPLISAGQCRRGLSHA
jgi:hypothetical protein